MMIYTIHVFTLRVSIHLSLPPKNATLQPVNIPGPHLLGPE